MKTSSDFLIYSVLRAVNARPRIGAKGKGLSVISYQFSVVCRLLSVLWSMIQILRQFAKPVPPAADIWPRKEPAPGRRIIHPHEMRIREKKIQQVGDLSRNWTDCFKVSVQSDIRSLFVHCIDYLGLLGLLRGHPLRKPSVFLGHTEAVPHLCKR